MEFKRIGNDQVSSIALGTWVFAADCWGGAERKHCISAACTAIKSGINMIDTAPIYGHGRAEDIVGEALSVRKEKVFVATKGGLRVRDGKIAHDLSPASLREEVDASLKRLGRDVIDLYQCHWPDPDIPIEKTMEALRKLQDQGKIRYIGVSNFDAALLEQAMKEANVVTNQVQYSLLDRQIEKEVLPFCREKGVGILAYAPLGGGILTGKYDAPPEVPRNDVRNFFYPFYQGRRFAEIKAKLDAIRTWGKPLAQVAINWVRQQQGVTSVLVGARNKQQVESNIEASAWQLDQDQINQLNKLFA